MSRRDALRLRVGLLALAAGVIAPPWASPGRAAEAEGRQVPVALAWGPGDRLLVACRDSRRILTVDPEGWRVVAAWSLPFRPVSLTPVDGRSAFLVGGVDGELAVLDPQGRVVRPLPQGRGPTRTVDLDDGLAAAASRWDASVRVVDWRRGRVVAEHRLPFAAGAMVRAPGGRVAVADAFAGHLATLVPGKFGSERVRDFDGVNLLALAISGDGKELLIGHMEPEDEVPVTAANIDRGLVLSGRLSAVRLADLEGEAGEAGPLDRRQVALDGPVHGAADPAALAVTPDGRQVLIALAGAHQVLKDDRGAGLPSAEAPDLLPIGHNQRLELLAVGRSPVALAIDPPGRLVVTADAMSDTLTVVRIADLSRVGTVALAPETPEPTRAQRGEAAFLDGARALDRWMSCASCHPSGHTNGRNFDTRGDHGYGAPKNTPSLLGVAGTEPFAWVGSFPRLSDQVHQSFETSLHGPEPSPGLVADLSAYLEGLAPPPPRRPRDDPAAARGEQVFRDRRCDSCHRPPLYTIAAVRDVGLDDGAGGHRRFNPPSLRGVAWTAPYLHDGRAATLDQVLDLHTPGQKTPLGRAERDDLIAFLESL